MFYNVGEWFFYIFVMFVFLIGFVFYFNGKMVMCFGMCKFCCFVFKGVNGFVVVYLVLLLVYDGLLFLIFMVMVMFVGFFFVGILFGNLNVMVM